MGKFSGQVVIPPCPFCGKGGSLHEAAPDLLAALEQIIAEDRDSGEVSDDAILDAINAIAKARGEG